MRLTTGFMFGTLLFAVCALADDPIGQAVRSGDFKKITSVLIARDGNVVNETYFAGDANTLRNTRSATKTVTGMLVGIAIDRGMLTPDTPLMKFFASDGVKNPSATKDRITIEDLLTMSSALDCNDDDSKSPGNEEGMYPTKDWVRFGLDLPVRAVPPKPERKWSYCTAGVTALAGVLERATHSSVPEFARKNLFEPLGIANVKWSFSPSGVAMTGGGLDLSTRDLWKLAQLYAQGGRWNGKQIVPEKWVAASIRPQARISETTEYGYLWWIQMFQSSGKSFPAYFMTGNGGNKVLVFPASGEVVVITAENYNVRGMHQLSERLLTDYILPRYGR